MALSRTEALALLPDSLVGDISAADMRAIIDAIYQDGVENIAAVENRVAYMQRVNEAIIGSVLPWDGTGTYAPGDTVLHGANVFLCLRGVAANHPAPAAGPDWAILDYVGQYATLTDLELRVHVLEAKP